MLNMIYWIWLVISGGLLEAPLYPLKPGVSMGPPGLSGGPSPLVPLVIRPLGIARWSQWRERAYKKLPSLFLSVRVPGCQKLVTNDGLTRSDTGCFIAVSYSNNGRQRVDMLIYDICWLCFLRAKAYMQRARIACSSVRRTGEWSVKTAEVRIMQFSIYNSPYVLWDKFHLEILTRLTPELGRQTRLGWGPSYFLTLCVNISKTVRDTSKLLLMTNRKLHVRFRFDWHDDLELSLDFLGITRDFAD